MTLAENKSIEKDTLHTPCKQSWKRDESTIIFGNLNILLSAIDTTTRQKLSKKKKYEHNLPIRSN